jgi:hypothetical protein
MLFGGAGDEMLTARKGADQTRSRIGDLIDRAIAQTGLSNFGNDTWREGLEVLVRSAINESDFNDLGETYFYDSLVRPLVNRLQIESWYELHPEIDEQTVELEVLGVGFPRTGSTVLSHMLGEDSAFRNLRMWEEMTPCPPPGVSPEEDQARIDAAGAAVEMGQNYMSERLRSMLPQSPTGPIEDHDLMALEFKAQAFLVSARIPTYADWFANCDMEPTYLYERRVLKLLQWKTPQRRWRVKSPTHTMFLDDYEKVFPDARFVQTHRDVSKVLPSVCDLYFTMLQVGNPGIDPVYVGELNMDQWGVALERCLTFRSDPVRDAKFFDIGFSSFQSDPIAELKQLYQWLGDELAPEVVDSMLTWRSANPKDKYGTHSYDADEFGLTDEALNRRFGAYRDRFASLIG